MPPAAPPAFSAAAAPAALIQLVLAERDHAAAGDAHMLAQLWAEDARIVDGRGTPDPADDYIWTGRAAILDRYALAVFPNPPPALRAADLSDAQIEVSGDEATLAHDRDRWRFVRRDGRWSLLELRY